MSSDSDSDDTSVDSQDFSHVVEDLTEDLAAAEAAAKASELTSEMELPRSLIKPLPDTPITEDTIVCNSQSGVHLPPPDLLHDVTNREVILDQYPTQFCRHIIRTYLTQF